MCYSGGRNLDNLVVGDGGPTSVGVFLHCRRMPFVPWQTPPHSGGGFSLMLIWLWLASGSSQTPPHFGGGFSLDRPAIAIYPPPSQSPPRFGGGFSGKRAIFGLRWADSQTPPHFGGGYSWAYLSIVNGGFAIPTFVGVPPARTYPIPHHCGSFRPGFAGLCAF